MVRRITSCVLVALAAGVAAAQPAPAPTPAPTPAPVEVAPEETLDKKIAVWHFDALGIDAEIVQRLETLFREELGRLDKEPIPSARTIERTITDPKERECTGEEKCLASIGKKLGVALVVSGTVGSLGDNYVLTIKVVEVATGKSQTIQSDPLRGAPDELIDGVRVLAYKLLAPDQLHGSVQIETDLVGASVALDGKQIGKTPLPNRGVISKLALGKHHLRVEAAKYEPIDQDVEVRFQKVSPVVVRLLPSEITGTGRTITVENKPFYTKTWFIVGAGVAAVVVGAWIGHEAGKPCTRMVDMNGNLTAGDCGK